MLQIMRTTNNRANYYLHDPFNPSDFADKESYNRAVHQQYLVWQAKYLE
jgi:1-acyl-sn-glycerol-3-phosphate acyltransferase